MKLMHRTTAVFIAGFVALSLPQGAFATSTTSAAPVPSTKENPGSLPILISLERVSKDLHLTSLQKSIVSGLRNDYRAAARRITQAGRNSSSALAQAQVNLDDLSVNYNNRALAVLNAAQKGRLRQVERQLLGGTLLTSPSEQKYLGLTDQQKKKITQIAQDSHKAALAINLQADQGKLSYHQHVMALRKNRQQHAAMMMKVLTPAQFKTWNEAKGTKLFSK